MNNMPWGYPYGVQLTPPITGGADYSLYWPVVVDYDRIKKIVEEAVKQPPVGLTKKKQFVLASPHRVPVMYLHSAYPSVFDEEWDLSYVADWQEAAIYDMEDESLCAAAFRLTMKYGLVPVWIEEE